MAALSLRSRLLLALAYVLVLAIASLLVPLLGSVRARVDAEVRSQARGQAQVVAASVPGLRGRRVAALADSAAASVRGRVLVLDRGGRVRADSASGVTRGRSYASRPEVRAALRGRVAQVKRHSASLGRDILATAVPVLALGRPAGAVRITQSMAAVRHAVATAELGLVLIGALVLLLGLAAGGVIARQIALPLHRFAGTARAIEGGELERRAPEAGSSEQRALARAFNDMTDRVTALLRAQREFVADASHQLRTPLAGLRLRIEEAAATAPGAAQAQLGAGLAEVDRLSAIVDELLTLSQAADARPPEERIGLATAVRAAAERWAGAAGARGSSIDVHIRQADEVRCAQVDLDRVLDVLVENALAYGPRGGPVRLVADGRRVEVHDAGPGPAPGEEEAVFARFHRGSAGRSGPDGTGLGLSIARELAGRWDARVQLGRGADGGGLAILDFDEPRA